MRQSLGHWWRGKFDKYCFISGERLTPSIQGPAGITLCKPLLLSLISLIDFKQDEAQGLLVWPVVFLNYPPRSA